MVVLYLYVYKIKKLILGGGSQVVNCEKLVMTKYFFLELPTVPINMFQKIFFKDFLVVKCHKVVKHVACTTVDSNSTAALLLL